MDLDHNLCEGAGTMFAGTVQQMREPSAEPGPSSQSNLVAIARAAALHSLNLCQDCGLKNCKGRNSKKPQKSWREGWDDCCEAEICK